jgi:hypothetical protein
MFTVVVEGEGFGQESFNYDTLTDAHRVALSRV